LTDQGVEQLVVGGRVEVDWAVDDQQQIDVAVAPSSATGPRAEPDDPIETDPARFGLVRDCRRYRDDCVECHDAHVLPPGQDLSAGHGHPPALGAKRPTPTFQTLHHERQGAVDRGHERPVEREVERVE
jgi:hypothetical protein